MALLPPEPNHHGSSIMLQSARPRDSSTPFTGASIYLHSLYLTPGAVNADQVPSAPPGSHPPSRPGTKSPKNKTESSSRRLRGYTAANAATRTSRRRAPAAPTRPSPTPVQAGGSRLLRPALTTFPGPGRRRGGAEASPPARPQPPLPPGRPSPCCAGSSAPAAAACPPGPSLCPGPPGRRPLE